MRVEQGEMEPTGLSSASMLLLHIQLWHCRLLDYITDQMHCNYRGPWFSIEPLWEEMGKTANTVIKWKWLRHWWPPNLQKREMIWYHFVRQNRGSLLGKTLTKNVPCSRSQGNFQENQVKYSDQQYWKLRGGRGGLKQHWCQSLKSRWLTSLVIDRLIWICMLCCNLSYDSDNSEQGNNKIFLSE